MKLFVKIKESLFYWEEIPNFLINIRNLVTYALVKENYLRIFYQYTYTIFVTKNTVAH